MSWLSGLHHRLNLIFLSKYFSSKTPHEDYEAFFFQDLFVFFCLEHMSLNGA